MRIPRIKSPSGDEQTSHDGNATARDSEKIDLEHTLLAVSLRIWGTTLLILALPVLGIATFQATSTGKPPWSATAELCWTSDQAPATRLVAHDRIRGTD